VGVEFVAVANGTNRVALNVHAPVRIVEIQIKISQQAQVRHHLVRE
jgi:hypothetical protein